MLSLDHEKVHEIAGLMEKEDSVAALSIGALKATANLTSTSTPAEPFSGHDDSTSMMLKIGDVVVLPQFIAVITMKNSDDKNVIRTRLHVTLCPSTNLSIRLSPLSRFCTRKPDLAFPNSCLLM